MLPDASVWGLVPVGQVGAVESVAVPQVGRQKAGIVGSKREGAQLPWPL